MNRLKAASTETSEQITQNTPDTLQAELARVASIVDNTYGRPPDGNWPLFRKDPSRPDDEDDDLTWKAFTNRHKSTPENQEEQLSASSGDTSPSILATRIAADLAYVLRSIDASDLTPAQKAALEAIDELRAEKLSDDLL